MGSGAFVGGNGGIAGGSAGGSSTGTAGVGGVGIIVMYYTEGY